jgi:hypothetical protein
MDIEQTAQNLRQLGCTQEQIERHIHNLQFNAKQSKHLKRRPEPTDEPEFRLTQSQIDAIMVRLRERQWHWAAYRSARDMSDDWVGHAILSVTGMPNLRSHTSQLVSGVLMQLHKLGLIAKVTNGQRRYVVHVVEKPARPHRERLEQSEPAKERALMGKTGAGHTAPAAHAESQSQASSAL